MKHTVLMLAITCFIGCSKNNLETISEVNESSLRTHIKILSSDDFQGRKPFSVGETKTINYITGVTQKLEI